MVRNKVEIGSIDRDRWRDLRFAGNVLWEEGGLRREGRAEEYALLIVRASRISVLNKQ